MYRRYLYTFVLPAEHRYLLHFATMKLPGSIESTHDSRYLVGDATCKTASRVCMTIKTADVSLFVVYSLLLGL